MAATENGEALKTNGPNGQSPDGPATTHVKYSALNTLPASPLTKSQQNSAASPPAKSQQNSAASPPAKSQQNSAMRAEPTHFGQAYSERNPPPNIQALREHDQARQEASRQYFDEKHSEPTEPSRPEEKKDTTGHEEPTKSDDNEAKAGATGDVPIGAEKSNVLFQPTPQVDFDRVFKTLHEDALHVSYVVAGSILVLDWLFIGGGFNGLLISLLPAIGVATAVFYILSGVGQKAADRKVQQAEPKMEKLRYVPESVEWMNSLVDTLWHTLQKDFFDNIATQVNDTIKPYIPEGVPATVKITELGHGCQSARILSMRSLPDSEFGDLVPTHGLNKSGSSKEAEEREKAVEREEGGVFYNLEIALAYHEAPFRSRKEQMHVDVLAAIGPVPLPVFVQVKEFVATIRIRLQMHPDLPFLKNLTFALTESPKINASVSLGAPWALDLLNLPIIDSVLASQIDQAAADFVQPKSMSLDMTAYVGGSDQMEETEAIGVLFVKIHRARKLARQDTRGPGADPYLTIAFSKYEKPMYATRIIKGDRNPVWEETAIIMIRAEHVKRQENVLLRLWDSDTTGSDDVSGVCEFPLEELILNANKMQKREDNLQGDVAGTDAEGVLEWEIGYFPRAEFEKALRTDAMDPRDHHGDTVEVAEEDKTQNAQNTVPDPNLPSGILGLTIHQCINVQVDNPGKKSMGNVKTRRQDSDGELSDSEETINVDYIPSLYVSADINDLLIYRTRVKSITSAPTFNSNTETYIRDWRLASLTLSVWDTRKKTDDCLVGVASLKLSEIFNKSSSVVKFYDLKGGAGTGRIRVSMIFRSMRMKLDESLLGFSVGSFVFSSPILCTGDMHTNKLRLRSSATTRTIKNGTKSDDGYTWNLEDSQNILPVHFRYMGPIVFEFIGIGLTEKLKGPLGKNKHYAVLWLFKLIDNKEEHFSLPIYHTNNPDRLTQNVVHESDDTMELKEVGRVTFSGKFKAGLDEAHGEFQKDHDHWSTYQSWLAARKSGE
ncbi:Meiotically up-regulated gene 190 protein [Lachnellula cervina]|uniref:Meiotically up-regulated gene 190 protein n=1 Tax=Lachnellula cervina TaxID=1316786 RepID=A0A7D8YWN4_9HELO|nr:Meiotically up-regulated gene 190 protein [Lachnellula cervina]